MRARITAYYKYYCISIANSVAGFKGVTSPSGYEELLHKTCYGGV